MIYQYEDMPSANWMMINYPNVLLYRVRKGLTDELYIDVDTLARAVGLLHDTPSCLADFELLYRVAKRNYTPTHVPRVMDEAASFGSLHLARFLNKQGHCFSDRALIMAAAHGHMDMLLFLEPLARRHDVTFSEAVMDEAAANGHLDIVKYLYENRTEHCTNLGPERAAFNGHSKVVHFLLAKFNHVPSMWTPTLMNNAARSGDLELVRYLHENRTEGCTYSAMNMASAKGHLDVVKYLMEHRTERCTHYAIDEAAFNGHLHIVIYLLTMHVPAVHAIELACINGYLDIIIYLNENMSAAEDGQQQHALVTTKAIENAALCGHLNILKYLYAYWPDEFNSTRIMEHAGKNGHIEVVQYLLGGRMAPFTEQTMDEIAAKDHLEIIKLLHQVGGIQPTLNTAMEVIRSNTDCTSLPYIMDNMDKKNEPLSLAGILKKLVYKAVYHGNLDALQYLHDKYPTQLNDSMSIDYNPIDTICSKGNIEMLKYIQTYFPKLLTKDKTKECLYSAALSGHQSLFKLLLQDYISQGGSPDATMMTFVTRSGSKRLLQYLIEEHHQKSLLSSSLYYETLQTQGYYVLKYLNETLHVPFPDAFSTSVKFVQSQEIKTYLQHHSNVGVKSDQTTIGLLDRIKSLFQ
ncbi:hypothetical protein SAMD00019534_031330 [Acytostelium subglobosum LB1]|uniref:hypothetical protein n=1 Tax=Acytostelium subglobosum LB1 TaxID=1410327 RepID=UPI000644EF49|nr:hypothetical protein SAMD00019534_031330 [Acytostelium subglobosum LB1]GAM19958.1 hypothetical protein SAMD00019534_031330 [Acytostelium subglobosum LB1]|eukprot:XP_012756720.1 hypothetical protein SAMD00019534_031330 [Acytostelium subglobosum LB1]